MTRHFYGIRYYYGVAWNNDGSLCGEVRMFPSKQARNSWVAESLTEYSTQSGYREKVLRAQLTRQQLHEAYQDLMSGERQQ